MSSISNKYGPGVQIIEQGGAAFPEQLRQISDPPKRLYCRGDAAALAAPCIAIVGSRKPTAYGLSVTDMLVRDLVSAGVTIVSGLAFGIDAAAHRAALKHGGRTVAVVPGGVDPSSVYPQSHSQLAEQVAGSGCIVSEHPAGSPILPYTFLARNRIIAGLSVGSIVVECAEKSGALITAGHAREYNRSVYAVPGSVFSAESIGPNELLKAGAIPVTSAADIFRDLGWDVMIAEQKREKLLPEQKLVLQYINSVPISLDLLAQKCKKQIQPGRLLAAVTALELAGLIADAGGGRYYLIN